MKSPLNTSPRREFIITSLKATGALTLLSLPLTGFSGDKMSLPDITVQDVIDIILKDIPNTPFNKTVDTIKSGNAGNKVTGIVTCMFATVAVIKEAIRLNANFIIAHEPTYYNHTDDTKWVENNTIVAKKMELLEKNKITVWRCHDYLHAHRPDGVFYGVVEKAGWLKYYKQNEPVIEIPGNSLKNIAQLLKDKLEIDHVKVIGNLSQSCKRILLMPGASGGQSHVRMAETHKPDLLIVGEVHEWETAEYIRDAQLLGTNISLIVLGHSVSEEPGLEWLKDWLQPKLAGIKITHISSKSPFTWV